MWGQCNKAMQEKLRTLPNFDEFNNARDVILLLLAIKAAMHKFDHRKDRYMSTVDAIVRFYNLFQGKEMANATFHE
eukprot:14824327-Ditylum_brightwellii.AAC.1